jgi:iron complex transport system substrate-binding protein
MAIPQRASQIPQDKRVTVYYAEGPNGLQTDPKGSRHTEVLDAVGAINVHEGSETTGFGRIEVSLEQVAEWDPDIILVDGKAGYDYILSDSRWQIMRAVRNNNVILIPSQPFDWFDRPPGINRVIGIPWLAKTLYPDVFSDVDLNSLVKEFYSKFYHYNLSDADVRNLMTP